MRKYKILDTENNRLFKKEEIGQILEGEIVGEYVRFFINNNNVYFLLSDVKEIKSIEVLFDNENVKIELEGNNVIVTRKLDNSKYNAYILKYNESKEDLIKYNYLECLENDYSLLNKEERYKLIDIMLNDTKKEGRKQEIEELLSNLFECEVVLEDKRKYLGEKIYRHTYTGYINKKWIFINTGWYYNDYSVKCINVHYNKVEYCYPDAKGLSCKVYHHSY